MKLLAAFRVVFLLAACLFIAAAGLVTVSLLIAERASQSSTFLAISIAVSTVFLASGLLMLGIQFRIAAIAKLDSDNIASGGNYLTHHLHVLVVYLILGGMALCSTMLIAVYAILARIYQGFAVFG
jgi:hypothetical protein